jgi:solute:Na+ symporter, SSS family
MHYIDLGIFVGFMLLMLGIGYYFMHQNKNQDDYFVGGRKIGSWHVGLSVAATDDGGGFSVGLGGAGFLMGKSISWMLFTVLLGGWLAGVFLIPRIKQDKALANFYTFPQIFEYLFSKKVGLVAAFISLIGFRGHTPDEAIASMICGGLVTLTLGFIGSELPLGLVPNFNGILQRW